MRVNLPDTRDMANRIAKVIEGLYEIEHYVEFEKKAQKSDTLGSAVEIFYVSDMLLAISEARHMLQYIYNMLDSLSLLFNMAKES